MNYDELEKNIVESLTASDVSLIPFLPYLLQDLWELGSNSDEIIKLLQDVNFESRNKGILDLACGKGAVSIKLAQNFNCKVKGIDIFKEFIDYALKRAKEYRVNPLCEFILNFI